MGSHFRYARASLSATKHNNDLDAVRNIWLLLAGVLAFFTVINVASKLSARFHTPHDLSASVPREDAEKTESAATEKQPASRTSRPLSATAAAVRIALFRCPVRIGPNAFALVSELAFIFSYIAANLLWLLLDTRNLSVNWFKSRAAMMASAQLPLVVALASKNNIISWLTGISYEKLNVLHRAAGRTILLFLWIHAICRVTSGLPAGDTFGDSFMQAGVISLAALTIGFFLSLNIFRHAFFEFFFVTHAVLMLTFLIGGFIHLYVLGYGSYVWPAILVWGLDRLFRAVRVVWNNVIRPEETAKSKATVELLTSDTVRLTFRRKFDWRPGQHAYISIPKISRLPSEAHPFTIASIPGNLDGTTPDVKDLVFLIRSRDGLTRRLKDFALENGETRVVAYVDGPYGSPPNLHNYSTCVLFSGGSGISYTLPLLLDLIRQSVVGSGSDVQRIFFICVVRGDGHLPWITEKLSKALATEKLGLQIEAHIYVTGANMTPAESSNSISVSEKGGKLCAEPESAINAPQIHLGRPEIASLLHDEISASSGPVSVDVAGPTGMVDAIRTALTTGPASPRAILKGGPSVTLHVETFGMARI